MPTNKQMSIIQGRTFEELDNWVDLADDEGPEWVADAPLGKRQRSQLNLGQVRTVKPEECTVVAWSDGYGVSPALSNPESVSAVGYSKRQNDNQGWRAGNVYWWATVAMVLAPGQAEVWAEDFANTRMRCTKYTVIMSNGDIERVALGGRFPKGKTMFTSGGAFVESGTGGINGAEGGYTRATIVEPIGDIFYVTYLLLLFDNEKQLDRVSAAYNKLADNLAEASGVTREPVDLNNLEPFKGDPSLYIPPSVPLTAGNAA